MGKQAGRCEPVRARGRRLTCRTTGASCRAETNEPEFWGGCLHVTGVYPTVCKSVNRRHDGIGSESGERYLRFVWEREAGRVALRAIKWWTGRHARLIYTAPGLQYGTRLPAFVPYCTQSSSNRYLAAMAHSVAPGAVIVSFLFRGSTLYRDIDVLTSTPKPIEATLLVLGIVTASGRLVPRFLQRQSFTVSDSFLIASICNAVALFITDVMTYRWGGMGESEVESSDALAISLKKVGCVFSEADN
jgi:hypothetical protein